MLAEYACCISATSAVATTTEVLLDIVRIIEGGALSNSLPVFASAVMSELRKNIYAPYFDQRLTTFFSTFLVTGYHWPVVACYGEKN